MTHEIEEGSVNVFQDLELPEAELKLAKVTLARLIKTILDFKYPGEGLRHQNINTILGISSFQLFNLCNGILTNFTLEDLKEMYLKISIDLHAVLNAYGHAIDDDIVFSIIKNDVNNVTPIKGL